ncbi:MAG: long-chain-fatty-acid--CoA ligase [Thermodesulfobacteriota bacterium]
MKEQTMDDAALAAVSFAPLTPLSFLVRSSAVFPGKVAVVDGETSLTWSEFAQHVSRAAGALAAAGVAAGDRVAVLAPNTLACLAAHFAVPLRHAVLVTINIRLAPAEIQYILQHSGAKLLVVDAELAPQIAGVLDEVPELRTVVIDEPSEAPALPASVATALASRGRRVVRYGSFLREGTPLEVTADVPDERMPLSINYTSGTTGRPKGVLYTHRGAYLNALGQVITFKLDARSVYLWTLPLFHCNGWTFPWAVAAVGGEHVLLRKVDPERVFELIGRHRVTNMCAAPTVLIMLANHPGFASLELAGKLTIATGGAPPAPAVIATVESIGAEIAHIYGLTETYGPHTICEWQPAWDGADAAQRAQYKSRQGVPNVTAVEMRVVDEDMNDVPADGATQGEVVMHGNNVMAGYFEDRAATAQAFRGGWFHSGDAAVLHPDGYIEIRDRKKDIIISGGENISTVEVERTIYGHPSVMEVAVVGVPDDKWGEVPKAFVTLKPGATLTEAELIAYCRQQLAGFKCPKAVVFGELPKTATGKIQKFVLREAEWKGRAKRVN